MAFKFNGVTTVAPYYFKVDLIDGDNAEVSRRNANWVLVRERKRSRIRKLYFKFRQTSVADTQTLLEAIKDEFFTVQYPDPYDGTLKTITAMVGNRNTTMSTYISSVPVWGEIQFNCVEQ